MCDATVTGANEKEVMDKMRNHVQQQHKEIVGKKPKEEQDKMMADMKGKIEDVQE